MLNKVEPMSANITGLCIFYQCYCRWPTAFGLICTFIFLGWRMSKLISNIGNFSNKWIISFHFSTNDSRI